MKDLKKITYFISGHRDITNEEFEKIYVPIIDQIYECEDWNPYFVIGDYFGVDAMAQGYLYEKIAKEGRFCGQFNRVTVYHMHSFPRNCYSELFNRKGGYKTDEERDAAMTRESDVDIAFVRPGRRDSGTAQNVVRRHEFNFQ